jgi:hypothetical protein
MTLIPGDLANLVGGGKGRVRENRSQELARPEGIGHSPPTIVIEGLDEMVQALLAA